MSKETKQVEISKEVEKEIKLIIREGIFDKVKDAAAGVFGAGKTSAEKEAEDAEKAKEGESWLPIWKELKEPYHSFFMLYMKFMESNDMTLDTERKTKIAELFRDRSDSAVRVVGGEMCSVGDPWMAALKDIADKYSYNLPPNCLTGGGKGPDPDKDGCPEGQVRDPETGECVDGGGGGKTPTTGGDGPVPIFKDLQIKDPETGKMRRVGAKEGGQGLQALLANWLAKNAPGEVDKKALQQAAGRLVKAVAAQLKTNDIAIQENQIINYVKSMLAEMSARPASLITRRGEQRGSIDRGELKKMIQRIAKGKIGKRGAFKNLNVDAVLQVAMDFLRAEKFNVVAEAVNIPELADELMRNARLDDKTALRLAQALTDEFGDKELFGLKVTDEKPEDDDFRLEPSPDTPEPEEDEPEIPPVPGSSDQILDGFKKRIKKLDLDSTEGRYGASEPGNEQAYLGAYMLYKAMKNALEMDDNDVKYKQVMTYLFGRDWGTPDSQGPARVQGGTQKLKEAEQQDLGLESEVESWLRDMIQTFEREGLADAQRASKASKEARGVKEPEEKGYEPSDATAVAGTINTKQIVAPQLKSAGVDLDSPEGQKFAKNLEKVVRRFLKRHIQRLGKEDIKLIAENEEYMSRFVHIIQLYTEKLLKERKNGL